MQQLFNVSQVENLCGISRQTIYRRMRAGDFPRPIKVGPRAVRWRSDELETWLDSRERSQGWSA